MLLKQDKHHIPIAQTRKSETQRKEGTPAVSSSVAQWAQELTATLPWLISISTHLLHPKERDSGDIISLH